jgi:TetR/AcrR family transcriptional regulator, cholesterol catabolism regulator
VTERARRRAQSRKAIIEAAAAAIARRGFHGMSMRDLARATDRSLAGFYNYFGSKEDVLFALQKEAFETLVATARDDLEGVAEPAARLYVFIHHHVRYFAEHPDVMRVLVHEAAALPAPQRRVVRTLKERYFEIGRAIVRDVVEGGCGTPGTEGSAGDPLELERATYGVFGMLNWVYAWYDPKRHGAPGEVASTIHRITLCGLVARCPYTRMQDALGARLETVAAPPLIGAGAPDR